MTYKIGDPVVDLAQGRPMLVTSIPGQTVSEWSTTNNYQLLSNYANSKFDPDPDEPVVTCVYVSDVRSEPSKDYTFPVSRVKLIDVHHADDGERIHDRIVITVLAAFLRDDVLTESDATVRGIDPDIVAIASELAEAANDAA